MTDKPSLTLWAALLATSLLPAGGPSGLHAQPVDDTNAMAGQPAEADEALRAWQNALLQAAEKAQGDGKMVIPGTDEWLFFAPELRHLGAGPFWGERARNVSRATNADWADPLPAILDFHQQLRQAGIELLIVPVPAKAAIYPEKLPDALRPNQPERRVDPDHERFYALLREQGVQVLDLVPLLRSAKEKPHGPLYCRQDTHWSGAACVLVAEALAKHVREQPWYAQLPREQFSSAWRQTPITGDLYTMLSDPAGVERESLSLRFVQGPDGQAPQPNRQSPVLLLGDSHTLVFHGGDDMHARGAGLLEQLAHELGFAPDLVGVRGSGATPSRIALLRRGDNLAGKKLVIWVFSVREFTEGHGWRKVPVIR